MTTTDYIFFGTLFAIIFGGLVVYLLYVAFRCASDPEYRGEVMKDVERMKKEKAAKKEAAVRARAHYYRFRQRMYEETGDARYINDPDFRDPYEDPAIYLARRNGFAP